MAEKDYGGGAGYATKQEPLDVREQIIDQEVVERMRKYREVLPAGRALDERDLEEMLDPGNQTSRALILKDRLARHAAQQLRGAVVLSERERQIVERHALGLTPDGDAYAYGVRPGTAPAQGRTVVPLARPFKAELAEWGENIGR